MTQEDRDLLYRDLCSKLPYGVFVNTECGDVDVNPEVISGLTADQINVNGFPLEEIKLILRPISSMTKEERAEYKVTTGEYCTPTLQSYDWLDKNHFDCRGLIPKGLALMVTENFNPYKL